MKTILFTLLLSPVISLAAQTGKLQGYITVGKEKALPAALITLRTDSSQILAQTHSDSTGYYQFTGLAAGIYKLECRAPGYTDACADSIPVENVSATFRDIPMFRPARDLRKALEAIEKGEASPSSCGGGVIIIDRVDIRTIDIRSVEDQLDSVIRLPGTSADTESPVPLPPLSVKEQNYLPTPIARFSTCRLPSRTL